MKYLIVNADDFGASRGINRGIMDAHYKGIVTSASLLVTTPWSREAASLGRAASELSVGLHVDLGQLRNARVQDQRAQVRDELRGQFIRFRELMGHEPTHLDSHYHVHRDPALLLLFVELARDYNLPLRGHSPVRHYAKFNGQLGGKPHPEQISPQNLVHILETEIHSGVTELTCAPGYVDPDFMGVYLTEREAELVTLCDRRVRETVEEQAIELVSYQQLGRTQTGSYAFAAAGDTRIPIT